MTIQNKSREQAAEVRARTQSVTRTSDAAIQGESSKRSYTEPSGIRTGQAEAGEAKPTYVPAPVAANKVAPTAPPDMSTGQAKAGTAKPTDPSKPPIPSADKGTGQKGGTKSVTASVPAIPSANKGPGSQPVPPNASKQLMDTLGTNEEDEETRFDAWE